LIHKFGEVDGPRKSSLAGMIAYAAGFDPQFKNNLIDKYALSLVKTASKVPPK
jgi:hypothetical protein